MPSTLIQSYRYDPGRRELTINFRTGRVHVYAAVAPEEAAALANARAKGVFFNARIRDRYRHWRVEPGPDSGVPTPVRSAGPEAMRNPPTHWDTVDEASDELFPASDPPAWHR